MQFQTTTNWETEANNSTGTADPITASRTWYGMINDKDDACDYFRFTLKGLFPAPNTEDSVEKELEYCKELIDAIKKNEKICGCPNVQEKLNILKETVRDDIECIETSKDEDAKTGHKTADTSFFGYKTYMAMTEERIITAAAITSGEKG